jgi:ketosteroid isomerase-like protein
MQDIQKTTIENYIRSYNAFDVEGMTKDLHPDVVFENVSNGEVDLTTNGIGEFRKQAEMAKGVFTQREQKITSWNFNSDTVTIDIDYNGVLAVDLPNGMKYGETLRLKGQSVFTFKGGKISRIQDKS